jgi:Holliday junction resolvasome RuvABC endonuclease subunit
MNNKLYLSIDPSFNNSAIIVVEGGILKHFELISTDKAKEIVPRVIELKQKLMPILNEYKPYKILIEDISYGSLQNFGKQMAYLTYSLCELFENLDLDWNLVSIGTAKKAMTGKGNSKKEAMVEALDENLRKEFLTKYPKGKLEHFADAVAFLKVEGIECGIK